MRRCSELLEYAELRISALDASSPVRAHDDHALGSRDSWDADGS
jgi:hypothetical protein